MIPINVINSVLGGADSDSDPDTPGPDQADDWDLNLQPENYDGAVYVGDDTELSPEELAEHPEVSIAGQPYQVEQLDHEIEGGRKTKTIIPAPDSEVSKTDVVAGPHLRYLIEKVALDIQTEEPTLWTGYDVSHDEFEMTGIPLSKAFEHIWMSGSTGSGKTSELVGLLFQILLMGFGFLYVDPKGEDSKDLLQMIPESLKEKVIIIDPTEEYTVNIDLFDVPDMDDQDERNRIIRQRIDIMKAAIKGETYSGINIDTIIEVVGRALIQSPEDRSFLEMFFILRSQERRQNFAQQVDDPILADCMAEVADMDDDQVRTVIKRLMRWVLDPSLRQIVAGTGESLNWREIIDENKMVILRTGVGSDSIKQNLTLSAFLSTWSQIQQRYFETEQQIPYFVAIDEFDDVANDQIDLESVLARARSMGFGAFIVCQYPEQIPDEEGNSMQSALRNNAKNIIAHASEDKDNARVMIGGFEGVEPSDLTEMGDYRVWTDVPTGGGERSDPLQLKSLPPMPPVRTEEETEQFIDERMREVGTESPTLGEMLGNMSLSVTDESTQQMVSEALDAEDVEEAFEVTENIRNITCKAVYDTAIRYHNVSSSSDIEPVPADEATDRIRRYLPDAAPVGTDPKLWGNVIEEISSNYLEWTQKYNGRSGEFLYCTEDGIKDVFQSGSNQNAGGPGHRSLLKDLYTPLTATGLVVSIPNQEGTDQPDAVGSLDDIPELQPPAGKTWGDLQPGEIADRVATFREQRPLVDRITDGRELAIEGEKSTGNRSPGQTVINTAQAINQGKRCLLACRPDNASNIYDTVAHDPVFCRSGQSSETERRFYTGSSMVIDGEGVYRPKQGNAVWVHERNTDQYVLKDTTGDEHARFGSLSEIESDYQAYPATHTEIKTTEDMSFDDWVAVSQPIIPEAIFNTVPDPEWWDIAPIPATEAGEDTTMYIVTDDPAKIDGGVDSYAVPLAELLEENNGGSDECDSSAGEQTDTDLDPDPDPEPDELDQNGGDTDENDENDENDGTSDIMDI